MIRPVRIVALVAAFVAATAGSAHADQQSDILADLIAGGVPSPTVTLAPPAGEEQLLRGSSATLPVLRVTYRPPDSPLLGDVVHFYSTGAGRYHVDTGLELVWELAILEAAKHELARGRRLSGVSITMARPNEPAEKMLFALPPEPPPQQAPATLSLSQVRDEARAALPAGLQPDIAVTEDAVGERIVKATMAVAPGLFFQANVHLLAQALGREQWRLASLGGNIGRVIVQVHDPLSGQPLYVAAHDMIYGHLSQWYAPRVAAWAQPLRTIDPPAPDEMVDTATKDALDQAGALPGGGS